MTQPAGDESAPVVLYEKLDGFARVTLNRPEVLNAINQALLEGLSEALDRAETDEEVRAVILTGAGRAFSAGGDLSESSARILAGGGERTGPRQSAGERHLKIWRLSKPVIAAVQGYAVGQACELAGMCDITIAAEDAKFGEIQIRHGYGPPVLITPFLLGLKQAKELMLLGELIDAREARRIGLVNRVVPKERVMEEAEEVARKIASLPRRAVRMNKALINRTYEIAGFLAAASYQEDPAFADLTGASQGQSDEETRARLRVLQERGWGAFLRERDTLYRQPGGEEEEEKAP